MLHKGGENNLTLPKVTPNPPQGKTPPFNGEQDLPLTPGLRRGWAINVQKRSECAGCASNLPGMSGMCSILKTVISDRKSIIVG